MKKLRKKLTLNKETISQLDNKSLAELKGGCTCILLSIRNCNVSRLNCGGEGKTK